MMTESERANRRVPRWNGLDTLVTVVAAALLVAAAVFLLGRSAAETRPILYTLRVAGISESDVILPDGSYAVRVDDKVYDGERRHPLGTVTGITSRQSEQATVRDGHVVFAGIPGKTDLRISVRADAVYGGSDGVRVGELSVMVGNTGAFCVGDRYFPSATVVSLDFLPEE